MKLSFCCSEANVPDPFSLACLRLTMKGICFVLIMNVCFGGCRKGPIIVYYVPWNDSISVFSPNCYLLNEVEF